MSDLLTEKIEVLTIHPYPITPEMMRHGKGVGGLDYSGSDEELYTTSSKYHRWNLEVAVGPADSGPDTVNEYQRIMTALCSEDHDFSIGRVFNSDDVYSDIVKGCEWGEFQAGVNQVDQMSFVFGVAVSFKMLIQFDQDKYEGIT